MYALTPTKDDGTTAKANDVVYVEPAQTVTDEDLAAQLDLDGMNGAFVADFLSACLTHERCGTHLYRSVAGRTDNPVLQARYERFGEQTLRHVEILEDLIVSSGGNPAYVSPLARAVEAADSKALEATYLGAGGIDVMAAEMAMLDAVFMAETVDHANWEALGLLAESLPAGTMREQLRAAVAEVLEHEEEHLGWARDARSRLTLVQASSSTLTAAQAKGEGLIAQVRGWFRGDADLGRTDSATPTASATGSTLAKRSATKKRATTKKTAAKKKTASKKTATKKKATSKKATTKKSATKKRATTKKAAAKKKTASKKAATKKRSATKKTTSRKKTASKKKAAAKRSTPKRASGSRKKAAARRS